MFGVPSGFNLPAPDRGAADFGVDILLRDGQIPPFQILLQ